MAFGTQTFGTETYNSEPAAGLTFSVGGGAAAASVKIMRSGGQILTIYSGFSSVATYRVRINGITCFSGVSGQGPLINSPDGTQIQCITPLMAAIGTFGIEVEEVGSGTKVGTVEVSERPFYGQVYQSRKMFPNWYATGPKDVSDEDPEPTP